MSATKLQKLVYYCQAWSLVWDDRPLFDDEIQAWANGPVIPVLYRAHRGQSIISTVGGNADAIARDPIASETVDSVLAYYGDKTPLWLSDLTHEEAPWTQARGELPAGAWSDHVISNEAMRSYYSSLVREAEN
ncbi:MAG TPA: type II toxin-antitoxin system antitoxin SocA domain-containing protein [Candidatus Elarobacter sp.]|nr:type II toxin-antitoxin system antitoxin SocA domain-containing protein [Candidatus Elarobacter sp.]